MPGKYFYPRLREEGDDGVPMQGPIQVISIHALREEGDLNGRHTPLLIMVFLSTPSARRATATTATPTIRRRNFYPRLREEGDPDLSQTFHPQFDFYPRLREEGDYQAGTAPAPARNFYPRSARRATAKTETKSLFSNKLYNILHEFRRALIYNGSKNYPNHAK